MGNCFRHQSPTQWGGDDWGSPDRPFPTNSRRYGKEEEDTMEEDALVGDNITAASSREVKIKITKKQLEELVGRADLKQISVEQVLAQLIKVGDGDERCWRPNLQSIPE